MLSLSVAVAVPCVEIRVMVIFSFISFSQSVGALT